jgi:alanine racemase
MSTFSQKTFAHPAWIEIYLAQFVKNILALKSYMPAQKICLAIKANAYGHGLIPIAQTAQKNGVDYLAVAHLQEGALLREAGITLPILVLGAIHENQLPDLLNYDLEFTIASAYKAELVELYCKQSKQKARVHIEIETGMQRTGMRPETAWTLIKKLQHSDEIELKGIYSHLACAEKPNDPITQQQITDFREIEAKVRPLFPKMIAHLANSGGILYYPEAGFDMIRPGILLFGYNCPVDHVLFDKIKPFFSIKAHIAFFKTVQANQGISYGHTYQTAGLTHIVTVPVGYGDGLRRSLSNKGSVLIHGKRYPIVGTICMDQFMVDIGMDEAYVGDEIVLIGKQGSAEITLEEMALLAETISYEILCHFNDRLPRIYYE